MSDAEVSSHLWSVQATLVRSSLAALQSGRYSGIQVQLHDHEPDVQGFLGREEWDL